MPKKVLHTAQDFMLLAIVQAQRGYKKGEVPVGAVVVKGGRVISAAYNLRESRRSAISHAEILAIGSACRKLRSWRLVDCEMYVTLEPCLMCAGAILQSRMKKLCFGAYDLNFGVCGSVLNLFTGELGCNIECSGGVLREESEQLLANFFKELREKRVKGKKLILN